MTNDEMVSLLDRVIADGRWRAWRVLVATADEGDLASRLRHLRSEATIDALRPDVTWASRSYDLVLARFEDRPATPVAETLSMLGMLADRVTPDGLFAAVVPAPDAPLAGHVASRLAACGLDWCVMPDTTTARGESAAMLLAGRGTAADLLVARERGARVFGTSLLDRPPLGQSDRDRRRRRMVRTELRDELLALADRLVERWGRGAVRRVVAGIDMAVGRRGREVEDDRLRPALFLLPGLRSSPWVRVSTAPLALRTLVARLEANAGRIRDELETLVGQRDRLDEYVGDGYMREKFSGRPGQWRSVSLFDAGRIDASVQASCPLTAEVLASIAPEVSGEVVLSRLEPGAALAPHFDDNNYKLTVHLGLRVPDDCALRVANEPRTWSEGRCLAFSDAFLHEAWNRGPTPRDILLLDVWHPDVSLIERAALVELRAVIAPATSPTIFERF